MTSEPSTDPPRRTRLSAPAREKQLLDTAERLFIVNGFDGVSIEDIARAAGVTRPTVYQHHGSRENLFLACVRRAREELEQTIDERVALAGDDTADILRAGGSAYFDLISADRGRWALLFTTSANLEGQLAEELTALRATTISGIAERIRQQYADVSEESVTATAYVISGIGEQLGRWWIENPRVSRKAVLDYYAASVLGASGGVRALPRSRRRRRDS